MNHQQQQTEGSKVRMCTRSRMCTQYSAMLISTLLLSACGGGGNSSSGSPTATLQTGIFIDSPVTGLNYTTPTHSGLTNGSGEFSYIEGEQVSFYLGNTFLGVSMGKSMITPFDLTGIKPLEDELAITASLLTVDANSFDRAINISTLLQTLDNDGNPDNGIDLKNAHKALAAINIPLFVKAVNFENQTELDQAKAALALSNVRHFGDAVKHLYNSLNIQIKSQKIAQQISTNNKSSLETVNFEYTTDGNISAQKTDSDSDGQIDITKQFTYDTNNNVTTISDSSTLTTETLGYDSQQNLISRSTVSPQGQNSQETLSYQNQKLTSFEFDQDANGSPDTSTQYNYDANGKLVNYAIDLDGDTLADTNSTFSYLNNEVSKYSEDSNNDGSSDITILYNYDAQGNRITQNISTDPNNASHTSGHFKYDQNNNPSRYELDRNLDGKADYIEAYQYNNQHQRIVYKRDIDGNGTWDFMAQYFYDKNGNRNRMIEDSDGNGIVDKTWEASFQAAILDNTWDVILGKL